MLLLVVLYSSLGFGQCDYNLTLWKSSTAPDWNSSTNVEVLINGVSTIYTIPNGSSFSDFTLQVNDNDNIEVRKNVHPNDVSIGNLGVELRFGNGDYLFIEALETPVSGLVYRGNVICNSTCAFIVYPVSFVEATSTSSVSLSLYSSSVFATSSWLFEYDTVASFDSPNLISSTITNLSFDVNNLMSDTNYYFRFTEVCATGSAHKVVFTAKTLNLPCGNIQNTQITSTSNIEALVEWDAGSDSETEWLIDYGVSPYTPNFNNAAIVNNVPELLLNNLQFGVNYDIHIKSICSSTSSGDWIYSNYTHQEPNVIFTDLAMRSVFLSTNPLITNTHDTNNDGEISVTEAANVQSLIFGNSPQILSYADLVNFPNLISLKIIGSDLTSLNLPNLPALKELTLEFNDFTSIDFSTVPALETIEFKRNFLTTLDFSYTPNLKTITLERNNITTLDISNLTALEELFMNETLFNVTNFDTSNNTELKSIYTLSGVYGSFDFTNNLNLEEVNTSEEYFINSSFINNVALEKLSLSTSSFQSTLLTLDLSNNVNLKELIYFGYGLQNLDLSQNTLLEKLYLRVNYGSSLSILDLSHMSNLVDVNLGITNTTQLNEPVIFGYLPSLINLRLTSEPLYNNGITITENNLLLNINQLPNLDSLNFDHTSISSLDLSNNLALRDLDIDFAYNTTFDTLDLSNNSMLETVDIKRSQITNIIGSPSMAVLNVEDTPLDQLDVLHSSQLTQLYLGQDDFAFYPVFMTISELNLSGCPNLSVLSLGYTPLEIVNLKSGTNSLTFIFFDDDAGLSFGYSYSNSITRYICVNEDSPYLYSNTIGGSITTHISSYCSFNPGGDFNEIEGTISIDTDNNGCDTTDPVFSNFNFTVTDGIDTGTISSNQLGEYYLPVADGQHTITPNPENPSYWNFSPPNVVVNFPTQTSPFTQDFCVTANGTIEDLEVIVVPLEQARPGFDTDYKVVIKNKGNVTSSGSVNLDFEEDFMTLLSSTPTAAMPATNQLSWSFSNLQPFQMEEYEFTMTLNTPTQATNPLNSNDILTFTGTVTGTGTDAMPADNTMIFDQTVVNSYDPNDKTCLEGETIEPTVVGEYVHYMIRFENTGTASAVNIVVKDEIDLSQFDITTLIPLGGSHDYYTRVRDGNVVEFIHENINLDFNDATNDGHVLFKIKTLNTLTEGDSFDNTAEIYFDFNFPIITNTETVTVMTTASIGETTDDSISVYPNPAKDFITVSSVNNLKSATLIDVNGRILSQTNFTGNTMEQRISLENLTSGVYFVTIQSNLGQKVEKVIVE